MSDSMKQLEEWVAPLLQKMEPGERRKLARRLSQDVARAQRERIKAQKNPDGTPFASRKPRQEPKNYPVRFVYRKPGGDERVASMSSYRDTGLSMTGYDKEAGGIRTFRKGRIRNYLKPESGGSPMRRQQGRIRRQAMFSKIRQAKYLKSNATPEAAIVGFVGQVARIAEAHQLGLRDQVRPGGPKVQYPRRELLGLSDADIVMIQHQLIEYFTPR
jgi:phage virion morphogenesis protein